VSVSVISRSSGRDARASRPPLRGAKSKKYVALGVSPDGKGCVREADFLNGTNRKDFGVIDFPNGDALPFVKAPSIMGLPSEVDKKVLNVFLKREFYLDLAMPAMDPPAK
jgi:hypothetical protein